MSILKVRDLMTTEVLTFQPTDTVKKAVIKFAVDNVTGAPIVDNKNHLLGFISQNDILNLIMKYQNRLNVENEGKMLLSYSIDSDGGSDEQLKQIHDEISNTVVADIMVRSVMTTSPDAPIMEVLKAMIEMRVNRLPVLEKGVLVGDISRGDIIFAMYKKKA